MNVDTYRDRITDQAGQPCRSGGLAYFNSFAVRKHIYQENNATHPSTASKLWYMKRPMAHLHLQISTSERAKIGNQGAREVYPLRRTIWAVLVGIV